MRPCVARWPVARLRAAFHCARSDTEARISPRDNVPRRPRVSQRPLSRISVALVLFLSPSAAWAYRPFVSTDAAVADPHEVEIELGYFNLERTNDENTFTIPSLVLNYGLVKNLEMVGEFRLEEGNQDLNIVDPGVFLKAVIREGWLQGKDRLGIAVEAGPLLPSTVKGERGVGFEGIGIVTGRVSWFTYHVNLGGGVQRSETKPFAIWGVIGELPIVPDFRLVAEVNGESTRGEGANNSALIGFIWKPTSVNLYLDAGVRHGISNAAPQWQFTLGLTYGFPLPLFGRRDP